jgi:hypothetical protein
MRKQILSILVLAALFGLFALAGAEAMPMTWGSPADGEGSPALAAALSLIPMPVALGQFYAGDWGAGLAFSFVEVAEVATMATVFAYEGGAMMYGGKPIQSWSTTGQTVFFSALGGFILTKFVDAFVAASTVEAVNKKNAAPKVSLALEGKGVGMSLAFSL